MPAVRKPYDKRNTAAWQHLRARVLRDEPVCYLRLPGCTYHATTVDHVIPVDLRPDLCLERTNLRGACAPCNHRKRHKLLEELLPTPPTSVDEWFE